MAAAGFLELTHRDSGRQYSFSLDDSQRIYYDILDYSPAADGRGTTVRVFDGQDIYRLDAAEDYETVARAIDAARGFAGPAPTLRELLADRVGEALADAAATARLLEERGRAMALRGVERGRAVAHAVDGAAHSLAEAIGEAIAAAARAALSVAREAKRIARETAHRGLEGGRSAVAASRRGAHRAHEAAQNASIAAFNKADEVAEAIEDRATDAVDGVAARVEMRRIKRADAREHRAFQRAAMKELMGAGVDPTTALRAAREQAAARRAEKAAPASRPAAEVSL